MMFKPSDECFLAVGEAGDAWEDVGVDLSCNVALCSSDKATLECAGARRTSSSSFDTSGFDEPLNGSWFSLFSKVIVRELFALDLMVMKSGNSILFVQLSEGSAVCPMLF